MLYISLIASTVLLLLANWLMRRSRNPEIMTICMSLGSLLAPFFMLCLLPTAAIQSLLLCVAVVVWRFTRRDPATFLKLSCGATLLAYGLGAILVLQSEWEYARLRRLYPFESMEARVPEPRRDPNGVALSEDATRRLSKLEEEVRGPYLRTMELQVLHEDAVGLFINSPGFGVTRMLRPSEWSLAFSRREERAPEQPGPRAEASWSPGEWTSPADEEKPLGDFLVRNIADFVNPYGFGYIKDRRHVAGFEPHRFDSEAPRPAERWRLQRLELVSLLLHDEPVAYVSDHLPEMNAAHDTPTRPLDRFERSALEEMRRGEDLYLAQVGDDLRMLGAVRSVKQCVECHGGGRGDLLGAFSYTLRAAGR